MCFSERQVYPGRNLQCARGIVGAPPAVDSRSPRRLQRKLQRGRGGEILPQPLSKLNREYARLSRAIGSLRCQACLSHGGVIPLVHSAICISSLVFQEMEYNEVLARVEAFADEEGRRPRILVRRRSSWSCASQICCSSHRYGTCHLANFGLLRRRCREFARQCPLNGNFHLGFRVKLTCAI